MHLNFMSKDNIILTEIYVNYPNRTVQIVNHTDRLTDRAFGCNENPSIEDFETFIEDRSIPQTRDNFANEMQIRGIKDTTPLGIVRHYHGRSADDQKWIDFIED